MSVLPEIERTGATRITILQVPPSLNRVGSRGHWSQFHKRKKGWQQLLEGHLLEGTAMDKFPARCVKVTVSGRLEFRHNRRRDEGNYRTLLEKALGDALVGNPAQWPEGRWLPDDTPEHYLFNRLELVSGCEQETTILDLVWELP